MGTTDGSREVITLVTIPSFAFALVDEGFHRAPSRAVGSKNTRRAPRKAGIPLSAEMPALVKATMLPLSLMKVPY